MSSRARKRGRRRWGRRRDSISMRNHQGRWRGGGRRGSRSGAEGRRGGSRGRLPVQLGEDPHARFQAPHPRLRVAARPLPPGHLPLERRDPRPLLVAAGCRALPVAHPALFLAPRHQRVLRQGRAGGRGIAVLGLVAEGGLLRGRCGRRVVDPDLALFRWRGHVSMVQIGRAHV